MTQDIGPLDTDENSGYVWDSSASLFYHQGSGFYYDPVAEWYYCSSTGVYYSLSNGVYKPLGSPGVQENANIKSLGNEIAEEDIPCNRVIRNCCSLSTSSNVENIDSQFPLWHYDARLSSYWYYDRSSRAYYLYEGSSENQRSDYEYPDTREVFHENSQCDEHALSDIKPCSGWVEETLIEKFLQGYRTNPSQDEPCSYHSETAKTISSGHSTGECMDKVFLPLSDEENSKSENPLLPRSCDIDNALENVEEDTLCNNKGIADSCLLHIGSPCEEERLLNEEREQQWQAQFGQVVRACVKDQLSVHVIALWDWFTTCGKSSDLRLVGRLVRPAARFHPSLRGSSGLIKTSPICETYLDLVKVSSGRIYLLHRPSTKYLATVTMHDSANPTMNWGFPLLASAVKQDCPDEASSHSCKEVCISKPFVPNMDQILSGVRAPLKRQKLNSIHVMTRNEFVEHEKRKQQYRDRAADRRVLHGGFGAGPGQKFISVRELEKVEADAKNEVGNALREASFVPPLGGDNIGRKLLENMGWKEGQRLGGKGDGLLSPLQAFSNVGQAGLGWRRD